MRTNWLRRAIAAAGAAGALLLGVAVAGPASADTQLTLVCVSGAGETMVNGTCVLPGGYVGESSYQALIESSNGNINDHFTVIAGSLPPGLSMPSQFNVLGTIVTGTPTQQGTFTFTLQVVAPDGSSGQQAYSITVGPPLPLAIVLPGAGSTLHAGTVGVPYAQDFFYSGGVAPYTWSVISGQLPPGLGLTSPYAPSDLKSELSGTPTTAGRFTFTMRVTDGLGDQATQQFRLTIQK
jgi:hypothetical protein